MESLAAAVKKRWEKWSSQFLFETKNPNLSSMNVARIYLVTDCYLLDIFIHVLHIHVNGHLIGNLK